MISIVVAAPIRPTSRSGNDVTAQRWAHHLTALGHRVSVVAYDDGALHPPSGTNADVENAEALLVLHARRGSSLVRWWRARHPDRPVIVALTGTDLYLDLPRDEEAMATVATADRLIVLQRAAVDRLDRLRPGSGTKTHVVHQSVDPATLPARNPSSEEFRVVVLAHLRAVKDPLLAARAARRLDRSSRVVVHHAGRALDADWQAQAEAEEATNPRYRWLREIERPEALNLLGSAHVLACTSVAEGGANVVTEALAVGVPVVGTRIDGNIGLLGADHPGLVPVGDEVALAQLLTGLEREPALLADLQHRTDALAPLTAPEAERAALAEVITAVTGRNV